MTREMNILCATDKNFIIPTYVTMWSVIKNHKDIKISFYLFVANDVTLDDKNKLETFIQQNNCSITFIDVDPNMYKDFVLSEKFPKAVYYRLLAHEYLPRNLDRVLYLDVDIIVDKCIYDDFYSLDFNDKYMIVTSHNPNPEYYNMLTSKIVNLEAAAKGEFFNSGVILLNLKKFREKISLNDYIRAYKDCERRGFTIFYDQGLLNYMFFDKCLYLSSMDYNFRFSIPEQYKSKLDKNKKYKKSIIHYTGMCQPYKPWDLMLDNEDIEKFGEVPFENKYFYVSKSLNELLKIWWKYAKDTPVYDEIYNQMKLKQKWFKRNLLDFMLEHNRIVESTKKTKEIVKTVTVMKNQEGVVIDKNFHYKAYKIGCILCAPFIAIKNLIRKKKEKNKGKNAQKK